MAEKTNGLVLNHLPYFYAGATASGRGTVQVSIQQGISYLSAIAKSLLRQGFKRQIYLSFHGPAHMTCSPMVRDFYDETGIPILYFDLIMHIMKHAKDFFTSIESFNAIIFGAYDLLGRLEDIPLANELDFDPSEMAPQSCQFANDLFSLAYQSGSIGYYFKEEIDHTPTPKVNTPEERQQLAEEGKRIIEGLVNTINLQEMLNTMNQLAQYNEETCKKYPWVPANFKF
jgi:creatinine amidohydrolase